MLQAKGTLPFDTSCETQKSCRDGVSSTQKSFSWASRISLPTRVLAEGLVSSTRSTGKGIFWPISAELPEKEILVSSVRSACRHPENDIYVLHHSPERIARASSDVLNSRRCLVLINTFLPRLLFLFVATLLLSSMRLWSHPSAPHQVVIDHPAPDFALPNEKGIYSSWDVFRKKNGLLLIFTTTEQIDQLAALDDIKLGHVGLLIIDMTKYGSPQTLHEQYAAAGIDASIRFDRKKSVAGLYEVDQPFAVFLLDYRMHIQWMSKSEKLDIPVINQAVQTMVTQPRKEH